MKKSKTVDKRDDHTQRRICFKYASGEWNTLAEQRLL